jgi:dihydroorotate dehydrogenase (fumarate)
MMNLATSYLGLELAHPFIAGASPMSARLDTVKRLEDAGCAAIVLHSLFEEQITMAATGRIHHRDPLDEDFAESLAAFPAPEEYPFGPEEYLHHLRRVKAAVDVPVVASLNGTTPESWARRAIGIQQAGADALELNVYQVLTDLHESAPTVETRMRDLVVELKRVLRIPVAVKLGPFFTAFGSVARQLDEAGADGLVIFNRFYQPDIDIREMAVVPTLELSRSAELLLRLRWLAILHRRIQAHLAVSGGVETPDDGIKALLAGADAVQMVSAILRHGPDYFKMMREGLERWMEWHHFTSIEEFRGRLSLRRIDDPHAYERGHYIRALHSWKV